MTIVVGGNLSSARAVNIDNTFDCNIVAMLAIDSFLVMLTIFYFRDITQFSHPFVFFLYTHHISHAITDWCGPCKALAPALEQMAVKAGGMFRLVKLNSDNERSASQALEVKALPTGETY